jgi:hypothetical protein
MAQTQILASIYAIMQINKVSIDDINKFYAEKQVETPAEKQIETPAEKQIETPAEKQIETPAEKQIETYSKSSIKWGDEAVDLFDTDNQYETNCNTNNNSWISVIKKKQSQPLSKSLPKTITKCTPSKQEKDKRDIVYTVNEFVQCIKEKKKLHIDFTIHDSGHCKHTFNGTLCYNVKDCGMIHIQRCINNLDCKYKNCQFLHADDMSDEEAYENYMFTMDEYNKIKKNKKVYM